MPVGLSFPSKTPRLLSGHTNFCFIIPRGIDSPFPKYFSNSKPERRRLPGEDSMAGDFSRVRDADKHCRARYALYKHISMRILAHGRASVAAHISPATMACRAVQKPRRVARARFDKATLRHERFKIRRAHECHVISEGRRRHNRHAHQSFAGATELTSRSHAAARWEGYWQFL